MAEQLLTIRELSIELHVSEKTLRKWVASDRVPYFKLGGLLRFRRSEVEKWLGARRKGGFDYAPPA